MRLVFIVLSIVFVTLIARLVYVVVPAAGLLSEAEPTDNTQCEPITIAPGTEDVVYDAQSGLVFVSAAERRSGTMQPSNGIYAFDLTTRGPVRLVSVDTPADFRPHGISLYRDGDVARLFVISHPASGDQVLIYDIGPDGTLTHVETVIGEFVRQANDIQATGPDSFYVTNDVYFGASLPGYLEAFFGLPLGGISHYDGQDGETLTRGLRYANGIHLNADGSQLYASAFLGREVQVFDRDGQSNAIDRIARHRIPLGLDNIALADDGMIYIAGNPEVFSFMAHQADPEARAPSQVVEINPETGEWRSVFYTDGRDIDSASVAVPTPDALLIGAVFDDHVLICPR